MSDLNIQKYIPLPSPSDVPCSPPHIQEHVSRSRRTIRDIMNGKSTRKLLIVGPCSIHDTSAALAYARKLAAVALRCPNLFIVMRTYFEKPRTITGWKGLMYDPHMDGSYNIATGILAARRLLIEINTIGLPCACEFLDPNLPQYYADLISWGAIGARTTESQVHRQMASGLSCPVGFKNSTSGSVTYPIHSIASCAKPHVFPGISPDGRAAIVCTTGNPDCHVVLRGSDKGPNYDVQTIDTVCSELSERGLYPKVLVDCSHGNSGKCHEKQLQVWAEMSDRSRSSNVMGLMIESFLKPGKCSIDDIGLPENYGRSITDACIGWEDTERQIMIMNQALEPHDSAYSSAT